MFLCMQDVGTVGGKWLERYSIATEISIRANAKERLTSRFSRVLARCVNVDSTT